jgi:hypothetical protein
MIEASPFDAGTAYVAVDRHRLDDFAPYLYVTHDAGKSWTLSVNGIPKGSFLNAVREDPKKKGLVFAGTEKGVYASFDGGAAWQPLQNGLPVTSVRDMQVKGDDLVIATHGRGFQILDDLSPLRQAAEASASSAAAFLYEPAHAFRVRPAGFTGTPMQKDEPMSPNPPLGAAIDFVLKAAPKEAITLSILDEKGTLVRRYSSADKVPPMSRQERVLAPEWLSPHVPLPTGPGMHRWIWPIRGAAPAALGKGSAFADGVWALPGRYTVELVVDGARLTRPLVVEPDPRVGLPPEAYARQHDLASRIETARESIAAATNEAEELHKTLRERGATALDAKLMEIAEIGVFTPRSFPGPPKSLESLRFLENAFAALESAVDGADADPTPDARRGYEKLAKTLDATLARWKAFRAEAAAAK